MRSQESTFRSRDLRKRSTDAEQLLWQHLRNRQLNGHKFRRQHAIGPFVGDFACIEAGLVIELDGGQHVDDAEADARRTAYLQAQGFRERRYWNDEVLLRLEDVLADVLRALEERPSPQPSPASGRGS
jgi:very-short-patch-repair endonuclease